MRVRPRASAIVNKANLPEPGEHYGVPSKPYVWRGGTRPEGSDLYAVKGEDHRYDGRCHAECEDVR